MRRMLAILLTLLLFVPGSLAEDGCVCGETDCVCFIQLDDGGMAVEAIQNALVAQGYLAANDDASDFDETTRLAVIAFQEAHSLSPTGTMDDTTLTLLLWGMTPEELDDAEPLSNPRFVWVPTDGGIRRHAKQTCSGMFDPRRVSVRNAELMGMQPCGRCNRNGQHE